MKKTKFRTEEKARYTVYSIHCMPNLVFLLVGSELPTIVKHDAGGIVTIVAFRIVYS